MGNRIVHFEIPADEPKKLISFYRDIFDWTFTQAEGDEEYWTIRTDGSSDALDGGLLRKLGPNQKPINFVRVDSLDEHLAKIEKSGGRVLQPKHSVVNRGWYAIAADPEGNSFGLWQDDRAAPLPPEP